jgi:hypothetical protein
MPTLVPLKKTIKSPQNKSKNTFNRSIKELETLRKKLDSTSKSLDGCVQVLNSQVEPARKKLSQMIHEIIIAMYGYYKNSKRFKKKERNSLRNLICIKIRCLHQLNPEIRLNAELNAIIEDLDGVDSKKLLAQELDELKRDAEANFKEKGFDIDLSHITVEDGEEEIMRKLFEAIRAAHIEMDTARPERPQEKIRSEWGRVEQTPEALQREGLNQIYKRLAKVFHPDLEQNLEQKPLKEKLMKQLISAYENRDLHELLNLEMKWVHAVEGSEPSRTEEQLKIYNMILKEQINSLKEEIKSVHLQDKYLGLQPFLDDSMRNDSVSKCLSFIRLFYNDIQQEIQELKGMLYELKDNRGEGFLKEIISFCD